MRAPEHIPGVLALLAVLFAGNIFAQEIVIDERSPNIIDRGIVVPDLNQALARRLAEEFADQLGRKFVLARLLIAKDRETLIENHRHKSPHVGYDAVVAQIRNLGMPTGPVARVISLGRGSKYSYYERGELIEENLASATDPTLLKQGPSHFYELLHFNVRQTHLEDNPWFLTLYLRALPDVSVSNAIELFRRLQGELKMNDLTIEIRSDAWFLDTASYPPIPIFTTPLEVPNAVRFGAAASLSCGLVDRAVTCTGRNFVP